MTPLWRGSLPILLAGSRYARHRRPATTAPAWSSRRLLALSG